MKKLILLISTLLVFATCFAPTVSAANPGLTAKSENIVKTGETFEVKVSIKNNPGFDGISIAADYDRKALTLVSAQNGEIFGTIITKSQNTSVIPYKIMWITSDVNFEEVDDNGLVVTYKFKVNYDAPLEKTDLKFYIDDYSNTKDEDYTFEAAELSLKIKKGEDAPKTSIIPFPSSDLKTPSNAEGSSSENTSSNQLSNTSYATPSSVGSVDGTSSFTATSSTNSGYSPLETSQISSNEDTASDSSKDVFNNTDYDEGGFPTLWVALCAGIAAAVTVVITLLLKKKG